MFTTFACTHAHLARVPAATKLVSPGRGQVKEKLLRPSGESDSKFVETDSGSGFGALRNGRVFPCPGAINRLSGQALARPSSGLRASRCGFVFRWALVRPFPPCSVLPVAVAAGFPAFGVFACRFGVGACRHSRTISQGRIERDRSRQVLIADVNRIARSGVGGALRRRFKSFIPGS